MKKLIFVLPFLFIYFFTEGQNIGISTNGATPNASALLDIDVSNLATKKGLLIPRMTAAEKTAMNPLPAAAQGLIIYQTDGIQGFYYNNSNTTTPFWSYVNNSDYANIWTESNSVVELTNSGAKLGIGNNAPDPYAKVQITGNVLFDINYGIYGKPFSGTPFNMISEDGFDLTVGDGATSTLQTTKLKIPSAFLVIEGLSTTSSVNFFPDGRIGIGNTAPDPYVKVQLTGSMLFDSNYGIYGKPFSGSNFNMISEDGYDLTIGDDATSSLQVTKLKIPSYALILEGPGTYSSAHFFPDGRIGIGNSAPDPYAKLQVTGNMLFDASYGIYGKPGSGNSYNMISENTNVLTIGDGAASSLQTTKIKIPGTALIIEGSSAANSMYFPAGGNVGIGVPSPATKLDVGGTTKTQALQVTTGATAGYVLTSDASGNATWQPASSASGWSTTGNAGTNPTTNFIGTTDGKALNFRVNNQKAGKIELSGQGSITSMGYQSLNSNSGSSITAFGYKTLYANTFGSNQVAFGDSALANNTTGSYNTAFGSQALATNTSAGGNVAVGCFSLKSNSSGWYNTGVGHLALMNNTTGTGNVGIGFWGLLTNTTGSRNTALGSQSLVQSITGDENVALGSSAMYGSTSGSRNVAVGYNSLELNQYNPGSAWNQYNVAIGSEALYTNQPTSTTNGYRNTAVGGNSMRANSTGSANIALGFQSGDNITTGSNNIIIGYDIDAPSASGSNQLSIGNLIFGTGINGTGTTLSTGNVGIGIASPAAKLEVAGQVKITGGTPGAGKVLVSDAVGLATWQTVAGVGGQWMMTGNTGTSAATNYIGTGDAVDFVVRTNAIERMRILSSGNVAIGNTVAPAKLSAVSAAGNPTIPGSASTGVVRIGISGIEGLDIGKMGGGSFASWLQSGYNGSTADPLSFQPAGGNVGVGTTNPGVKFEVGTSGDGTVARANAWNIFSDRNLKKNFSKIENPLEKIEQMGGYYYHWKSGTDTTRQVGVIAQEVEAVFPEIVKTDDKGIKSVDYSKLSAVLIEGMKAQQKEIQDSNIEIKLLKEKIMQLEQRMIKENILNAKK
jgi:hypothetical protein